MAEVVTSSDNSNSMAVYKRQLLRFLILGNEQGTYNSAEPSVIESSAPCVHHLLESGQGQLMVDKVKKMVEKRRSIRMNAPLHVLAMCCRSGDEETRKAAYKAVPEVCTIPTHLFKFLESVKALCPKKDNPEEEQVEVKKEQSTSSKRGKNFAVKWNRSMEKTVREWYTTKTPQNLAMLVTKYRRREGWTHKDVLKNSHIKSKGKELQDLSFVLCYITKNLEAAKVRKDHKDCSAELVEYLDAVEEARIKKCPADEEDKDVLRMVELINKHKLLREHVPSAFLRFKTVWQALVKDMPMTALLKNLNRITSSGMLSKRANLDLVLGKLKNMTSSTSQMIHPYTILTAWYVYKDGHGKKKKGKSKQKWNPEPEIVEGLETAFYQAFGNVEPTNKRIMIALDVSQSMGSANVSSGDGRSITARVASAAMCLVTLHAESRADVMAFSAQKLQNLALNKDCKLDEALKKIERICPTHSSERLDCAKPMVWAADNKKDYDAFIIYTDNNTETHLMEPAETLRTYRQQSGISNARLAVVGMSSMYFRLADPNDQDMLDVVGFDLTTPNILHDFISGCLQDCQ